MLQKGPQENVIPCFKVKNIGNKMFTNVVSADLLTYNYKQNINGWTKL